jgi:hypothetical protein
MTVEAARSTRKNSVNRRMIFQRMTLGRSSLWGKVTYLRQFGREVTISRMITDHLLQTALACLYPLLSEKSNHFERRTRIRFRPRTTQARTIFERSSGQHGFPNRA